MDQSTITELVRRGCRNPRLSSTDITAVTLRGVSVLGLEIKRSDPSFFLTRKSISSYTHVFSKPSDCGRIEKIWDLGTTATAITGSADNGSGLVRMTAASHGYADDAVITQHDIVGTTEANGTFRITYVDDDTYDLQGSAFVNAWVSGGYSYQCQNAPIEIILKNLEESDLDSGFTWYPRGSYIIVDDETFTNDIMIDYEAMPDSLSDIPAEFHEGLSAWCVLKLIRIPGQEDPQYLDFIASKQENESMYQLVIDEIRKMKPTSEPKRCRNVWKD
jgi:hypothetical protein